jgi:hypothetical protein
VDPKLFSVSCSDFTFNFGSESGLYVKHAFLNLTLPFSLYREVLILLEKLMFNKVDSKKKSVIFLKGMIFLLYSANVSP